MIKKLFIGLLLLAVIGAAAIYFLGSSALNQGVKSGLETYGPRVTQTPITLGEAKLSIFSGSGVLSNLLVGNPEGFKSQNIFALGEIDVKVDTGTVFGDTIVIEHIIIRSPEISYEQSLRGSNVKQLMNNIEQFTGPQETAETEAETGAKKQVVIRKLLIEDATVYVGAMGVGQTVSLPRIEMENIGESGDRITMAEAVDLVLAKVVQAIGPAISSAGNLLKEGGQSAIESATKEANKMLNKGGGDAVNEATESIKGLFGN